jgi:antitoxin component YwqK of YwqJK toxin-antitoxin module
VPLGGRNWDTFWDTKSNWLYLFHNGGALIFNRFNTAEFLYNHHKEVFQAERVIRRHPNGLKELVLSYRGSGNEEEIACRTYYYSNGKVRKILRYAHSRLHGFQTRYTSSGDLKTKFLFIQGDLHSVVTKIDPASKTGFTSTYFRGEKTGVHSVIEKDRVVAVEYWNNGILVDYYDENHIEYIDWHNSRAFRDNFIRCWNDEAVGMAPQELKIEYSYSNTPIGIWELDNGQQHGLELHFTKKYGVLQAMHDYLYGVLTTSTVYYPDTCSLELETEYTSEGEFNGFQFWGESGYPMHFSKGYAEGNVGEVIQYDLHGEPFLFGHLKSGKPTGEWRLTIPNGSHNFTGIPSLYPHADIPTDSAGCYIVVATKEKIREYMPWRPIALLEIRNDQTDLFLCKEKILDEITGAVVSEDEYRLGEIRRYRSQAPNIDDWY